MLTSNWMKAKRGLPAPPPPPRVDLAGLVKKLDDAAAVHGGQLPPAMDYLKAQMPPQIFDRWGQPLPLSIDKQERLDRLVAILAQPLERGRALLVSGTLDTIEADALRNGWPTVYDHLKDQAIAEMAEAGPPLPVWSEGVLGILFGRDAALVYVDATHEAEKPTARGGAFPGKAPLPTPADQSSEPDLRPRRS